MMEFIHKLEPINHPTFPGQWLLRSWRDGKFWSQRFSGKPPEELVRKYKEKHEKEIAEEE